MQSQGCEAAALPFISARITHWVAYVPFDVPEGKAHRVTMIPAIRALGAKELVGHSKMTALLASACGR